MENLPFFPKLMAQITNCVRNICLNTGNADDMPYAKAILESLD